MLDETTFLIKEDYELVWDVVRNKIPELRQELEMILREEGAV